MVVVIIALRIISKRMQKREIILQINESMQFSFVKYMKKIYGIFDIENQKKEFPMRFIDFFVTLVYFRNTKRDIYIPNKEKLKIIKIIQSDHKIIRNLSKLYLKSYHEYFDIAYDSCDEKFIKEDAGHMVVGYMMHIISKYEDSLT